MLVSPKDIMELYIYYKNKIDNIILDNLINNYLINAVKNDIFLTKDKFIIFFENGFKEFKYLNINLNELDNILLIFLKENAEFNNFISLYKKYNKSIVYGKILGFRNKDVIIKFDNLTGICLESDLSKEQLEFDKYYWFYVKQISKDEIFLSRNSISLLKLLLKKYLTDNKLNIKFFIKKRIAGKYSEIIAERDIPKEIKIKLSRDLNEVINVKIKKEKKSYFWES